VYSVFMWNAKYWDDACRSVGDIILSFINITE
jgi:hypothetical protein